MIFTMNVYFQLLLVGGVAGRWWRGTSILCDPWHEDELMRDGTGDYSENAWE